jgi:hypothetical protein
MRQLQILRIPTLTKAKGGCVGNKHQFNCTVQMLGPKLQREQEISTILSFFPKTKRQAQN